MPLLGLGFLQAGVGPVAEVWTVLAGFYCGRFNWSWEPWYWKLLKFAYVALVASLLGSLLAYFSVSS